MTTFTRSLATAALALALAPMALAQNADTAPPVVSQQSSPTPLPALPAQSFGGNVLYSNGPLFNSAGTGVGGADESILEAVGTNNYGFGVQLTATADNRIADDFTVPTGETWELDEVATYGYQSFAGNTSTFTNGSLNIWDGDPSDAGSSIIFSTTGLASTSWTGVYRTGEVGSGCPSGSCADRAIMENIFAADVDLTEGTYWIDFQFEGSAASGPWANPSPTFGACNTGNAQQSISGAWATVVNGTCPPGDEFPFEIRGTMGGGGGGNLPLTFNGDTTGGPTWDRPFTVGDGTSGSCSISGTGAGVTYQTFEFSTDTDGDYVIGITTGDAGFDTYLLVYEGSFDPADQCVDLIALDDDDGSTSASTIGAGAWSGRDPFTLSSSEMYTIVVSGFSGTGDDFGAFDGMIDGPAGATVTLGGGGGGDNPGFRAINLNGTTVPSSGGRIRYKFELDNSMNSDDAEVDIWASVADATGTNIIYIRRPRTFMVSAGAVLRSGYNQRIPDYVPDGTYIYTLMAGDYNEDDPENSDAFGMEVYSVTKGGTLTAPITLDQFKALSEQNGAAWTEAFVARIPEITPVPNAKDWDDGEFTSVEMVFPNQEQVFETTAVVADGVQVGPNPITTSARFAFEVTEDAQVNLAVYDLLGRQVSVLVNEALQTGSHTAVFDATSVPAGTYVYRLTVGSSVQSGRVTVVR